MESRLLLAAVAWDGGGDGINWNDPNNWDGNALPGPADDVTVSVTADPTIALSQNVAIRSLVSNENLWISGGTLSTATASQIDATLNFTSGTLTGSGDLTITGALNWSGGTMAGSGKTMIAPAASIYIDTGGSSILLARVLENAGTGGSDGSQPWQFQDGTLSNLEGASFLIKGASILGTGVVNNAGTLLKTYNAPLSIAVPLSNTGTIEVRVGTLSLDGGGQGGSYLLSGGNLLGSGDITVTGSLIWTGGTMAGSGRTMIAPAASIYIDTGGSSITLARVLENAGTGGSDGSQPWQFQDGRLAL